MKSELRFNAIFEQAAVGFAFIESKTGRLIKVNNKFCDIIGFEEKEALASTFMAITHPDDIQEDLDNMQKLLKGELRSFTMEKRYIRKDDSIVWGNLTVSALWSPGDKPDYHIAVVEDITLRKQVEKQLHDLNNLLDQRIEKRTADLLAKTKELEEINSLLKKSELELMDKNRHLEELNTTLEVLINYNNANRLELEEKVLGTIQTLIGPYMKKLAQICPEANQQDFIKAIHENLNKIVSPFSKRLSSGLLTATEIKVADFIRHGHNNKEIAELLNMAPQTVAAHRKHIRKKLTIKNKKISLSSYLNDLS